LQGSSEVVASVGVGGSIWAVFEVTSNEREVNIISKGEESFISQLI